jgi:hypothetical protein
MMSGWRLTTFISAAVAAMALAIAAAHGFVTEGITMAIRATARTSLILFCLAFAASSLIRLWPNDFTRWTMRNRRHLGVSFAASHLVHGLAIIAFAVVDPVAYQAQSTIGMYVFGGLGYAFIAVMAATSFDATAEAIGPRAWRVLHWAGAHYIWITFAISNAGRIPRNAIYAAPVTLLALVMALRLAVWLRDRAAQLAIARA